MDREHPRIPKSCKNCTKSCPSPGCTALVLGSGRCFRNVRTIKVKAYEDRAPVGNRTED